VDHGEDLATRAGAADPADEAHRGVDERLEAEPGGEGGDEQQARVSDEGLVVEGHPHPVQPVLDCAHRKCLLTQRTRRRKTPSSSLTRRHFPRIPDPQPLTQPVDPG